MTNIKNLILLFVFTLCMFCVHAKIWRVNNNTGVVADFITFTAAVTSASVLSGDTIHIEPSATSYGGATISKRLVVIGAGYLLNPAAGGNTGLQVSINTSMLSSITILDGANGSRFLGIYLENTVTIGVSASTYNLLFEKCNITSFTFAAGAHDGISIRKCYNKNRPVSISGGNLSNFVMENCLLNDELGFGFSFSNFTGTGCVVRNNGIRVANVFNCPNAYVANNIIISPSIATFTNSNVKNNIFSNASQTFPGGAVANQTGVPEANIFTLTGSDDARFQLKIGSPAIAAGVTIAGYTPDCGAFGSTDPYKLSGIPPVPSIYLLTVPASIPSGSATMNITFSTRNNN
ncbi:MAG: hypothetical protein ACHQFX_03670 [Chitinophagales bacterium]